MTTSVSRVRIAVDAMGGDFGPAEIVAGAAEAARAGDVEILLVGDEEPLKAELAKLGAARLPLAIVPSQGVIHEGESPVHALRQNPRASVAVAGGLVKAGKAAGFVTMGSTGAAVAVATFTMGTLDGVERASLGGPIIGFSPKTVLVDLGSNVDTRPAQMVQFAAMGAALARVLLDVAEPRVALLSVGAEEGKGNRQAKEAYPLLKASGLRFVGNVEGHDLFLSDPKAEVVVCDGFVGNVLLKVLEGVGAATAAHLEHALAGKLPDAQRRALIREVYDLYNVSERFGGGPLMGINGVAVVGHGRARAAAIAQAINTARRCIQMRLVDRMREELGRIKAAASA
ncbi:MAG: phosphate acyltransferase PlsX [Dehalococcoidia bacterium]|nr:phosphate acyltransferase PlsX [Dehalococcoidia bacterium]